MSETAKFANVVLPGESFFEKRGTFTNGERRVEWWSHGAKSAQFPNSPTPALHAAHGHVAAMNKDRVAGQKCMTRSDAASANSRGWSPFASMQARSFTRL
jgi:NADH dehydrogenase/NADH:ubiquinone oxidoreductase subunit G